ncbi:unnamed protein product, partial [Urochloa humidicola]
DADSVPSLVEGTAYLWVQNPSSIRHPRVRLVYRQKPYLSIVFTRKPPSQTRARRAAVAVAPLLPHARLFVTLCAASSRPPVRRPSRAPSPRVAPPPPCAAPPRTIAEIARGCARLEEKLKEEREGRAGLENRELHNVVTTDGTPLSGKCPAKG